MTESIWGPACTLIAAVGVVLLGIDTLGEALRYGLPASGDQLLAVFGG